MRSTMPEAWAPEWADHYKSRAQGNLKRSATCQGARKGVLTHYCATSGRPAERAAWPELTCACGPRFAVSGRCRWSVGRGDTPMTSGSQILGCEEESTA